MITVNGHIVDYSVFSGGEVNLSVGDLPLAGIPSEFNISAHLHDSDDIMALMLTVDAIRRHSAPAHVPIHLYIPYFPYARQDRVCNKGEAHGAAVMSSLINNLCCATVTILDPHSDVTPALLNNCVVRKLANFTQYLTEPLLLNSKITLLSPDSGAEKRTIESAKELEDLVADEIVYARKVRDFKSGNIIETEIYGDVKGKDILIADDICDGGRTFIILAEKLKERGAKKIFLYISHGIFCNGLEDLKKNIDRVYCHNIFHPEKYKDDNFLIQT